MTLHMPDMSFIDEQLTEFIRYDYLGDGAYVGYRGHDICVFTSDGISIQNRVYLGPREFGALVHCVKHGPLGVPNDSIA